MINCGGTKFTTTKMTVERCAYLAGQLDWSRWEEDPTNEFFLDRDPALFEHLLRLMRQVPLVAGLLPRNDSSLFANLLAEADFLGFDALLTHVKAKAYYNCHEAKDDPKWMPPAHRPEGYRDLDAHARASTNAAAHKACGVHRSKVREAFETKDDEYGAARFDERYGSIADALAADVLPTCYTSAPKASTKMVQVLPVESTTWLLIGDLSDANATVIHGEVMDELKPMSELIKIPNLVRRVAYNAVLENERGQRWMEPLIYLEPFDQQLLMTHSDYIHRDDNGNPIAAGGIGCREFVSDPNLAEATGGHARRILRAQEYMEQITSFYWGFADRTLWTHLLVQEAPPAEIPFDPVEAHMLGT